MNPKLLVMIRVQISSYVTVTSRHDLANKPPEYRTICLTRRQPVLAEGYHGSTFPVKEQNSVCLSIFDLRVRKIVSCYVTDFFERDQRNLIICYGNGHL